MRLRKVLLGSMLGAALVLGGFASAVHAQSPCPPGQPPDRPPGHPPGTPGQPTGRPPQYPPGFCQLQLSQSSGTAGTTVQAAGSGFASGSTVELSMSGVPLVTTTAGLDGSFTAAFAVPDIEAGEHRIAALGVDPNGNAHELTGAFEVQAAGAAPSEVARGGLAGLLARTGLHAIPISALGVLMVVIGAVAVAASRRRQRTLV